MLKYLVILTKTQFAADRLAEWFKPGEGGVTRIRHGAATSSNNNPVYGLIPPIYCDQGYFYCAVTFVESAKVERYRLIFA